MAYGWNQLLVSSGLSGTQEDLERYVHQGLVDLVLHEVGHTLGLRHNFKGSSIYSVEQLSDKNFTQKFDLIFKDEKTIRQVFDCNKYLILDAVDENLNLFSDCDSKIYSNAIFSFDKDVLNSPMLLVYGSIDNHFLSNKAFDLIFYLSKIIEKKIIDLV